MNKRYFRFLRRPGALMNNHSIESKPGTDPKIILLILIDLLNGVAADLILKDPAVWICSVIMVFAFCFRR